MTHFSCIRYEMLFEEMPHFVRQKLMMLKLQLIHSIDDASGS